MNVTPEAIEATWTLLRTLVAWTPGPRSGRVDEPRGFAHGPRFESCPDCLANGRVMPSCETCHGTGEVLAIGDRDPYERKQTAVASLDQQRRRDSDRARDAQLARLTQNERVRAGAEAQPDALMLSVEARDRQYRSGDYQQLERALQWLRDVAPFRASQVWRFVVYGHDAVLSERMQSYLDESVAILARRMLIVVAPRTVLRVPASATPEAVAGARKEMLWRGRGAAFEQARRDRDDTIRQLAAAGLTAGQISRRVALDKRSVQRKLADLVPIASYAATAVASGSAA